MGEQARGVSLWTAAVVHSFCSWGSALGSPPPHFQPCHSSVCSSLACLLVAPEVGAAHLQATVLLAHTVRAPHLCCSCAGSSAG